MQHRNAGRRVGIQQDHAEPGKTAGATGGGSSRCRYSRSSRGESKHRSPLKPSATRQSSCGIAPNIARGPVRPYRLTAVPASLTSRLPGIRHKDGLNGTLRRLPETRGAPARGRRHRLACLKSDRDGILAGRSVDHSAVVHLHASPLSSALGANHRSSCKPTDDLDAPLSRWFQRTPFDSGFAHSLPRRSNAAERTKSRALRNAIAAQAWTNL